MSKSHLDWSSYRDAGMGDAYADIPKTGGDFARAIAVCIHSGQCARMSKGVMCPSYRQRQEGNYSTGGRVRLLKQLLNEEIDLHDQALVSTMMHCLGCKGCKRECENAVDMAMIRIEYLARYHQLTGVPLRTRLLAGFPLWLNRYGWLKAWIGRRNRYTWLARWTERLLNIAADVRLPEPVDPPFDNEHVISEHDNPPHEVALLIDSFSQHFAPQHIAAATQVLTAAGYRVHRIESDARQQPVCCGRSLLAHGLVNEARKEAERMLTVALPHVQSGRMIVGLEPACLLALRDDYRFLGLGAEAEQVASGCLLFEEFVARESVAGRFRLQFREARDEAPVLIHGHCHQKAVGAMKSMRRVLKMIPGLKFKIIEASCCGMAGSFGIEKEHAADARSMAEQALLPALRQQPEARVVANGFSCRHQIDVCENRASSHLAMLMAEYIL